MKKLFPLLVFSILTMCVAAQLQTKPPKVNHAISNEVIQSYNWWQYINPTGVNYFATFTNVNPINYGTGVVNYSQRTAISLVGWLNSNIDRSIAISDDSLVHLEPLVYLEQLLVSANIGDAGIRHLKPLRSLRHFEIAVAGVPAYNITDQSMAMIGALKNMEILRLYFCSRVTDLGIEQLVGLTNLRELTLNGCGITNRSLDLLSKFSKLETLGLAATSITDEGVETIISLLPSLPALNKIIINNSQVSKKGRENLIGARKGMSVIY
jgi:hypothetical protein